MSPEIRDRMLAELYAEYPRVPIAQLMLAVERAQLLIARMQVPIDSCFRAFFTDRQS